MQLALQIADSTAASGISAMNFVISLEHGEYSWNEGAQCHLFWLQSSLHRWNHPETPFAMAAAENLPVGYSKTHKQQQKKKKSSHQITQGTTSALPTFLNAHPSPLSYRNGLPALPALRKHRVVTQQLLLCCSRWLDWLILKDVSDSILVFLGSHMGGRLWCLLSTDSAPRQGGGAGKEPPVQLFVLLCKGERTWASRWLWGEKTRASCSLTEGFIFGWNLFIWLFLMNNFN